MVTRTRSGAWEMQAVSQPGLRLPISGSVPEEEGGVDRNFQHEHPSSAKSRFRSGSPRLCCALHASQCLSCSGGTEGWREWGPGAEDHLCAPTSKGSQFFPRPQHAHRVGSFSAVLHNPEQGSVVILICLSLILKANLDSQVSLVSFVYTVLFLPLPTY